MQICQAMLRLGSVLTPRFNLWYPQRVYIFIISLFYCLVVGPDAQQLTICPAANLLPLVNQLPSGMFMYYLT